MNSYRAILYATKMAAVVTIPIALISYYVSVL